MGAEAVVVPASFFWPVAVMALAVVFGAGGVVFQVRSLGHRFHDYVKANDTRWFEHVEGHAPRPVAGGGNGEGEN